MKIFTQSLQNLNSRESNYDLLRVICAFAVIAIHVSAEFINAMTISTKYADIQFHYVLNATLWNVLPRFAVPCFVMLSGAFILSNEKNANFSYFYNKSIRKFLLPVLLFSFIYYLLANILIVGGHHLIQKPESLTFEVFIVPLANWLRGVPYYHLWYMYMLIGLYLLVPIIIRLKDDITDKVFEKIAWILLVLSSIFAWGGDAPDIYWNPSYSFDYLGYFMIGYVLRKRTTKNNFKGLVLIFSGITLFCLIAYIRFIEISSGISSAYSLISPHCPLIVVASIFIFSGFASININYSFDLLSKLSFIVYLIHAGVLQVIQLLGGEYFLGLYQINGDSRISIPLICILTFVLSSAFAFLYEVSGVNARICTIVFHKN